MLHSCLWSILYTIIKITPATHHSITFTYFILEHVLGTEVILLISQFMCLFHISQRNLSSMMQIPCLLYSLVPGTVSKIELKLMNIYWMNYFKTSPSHIQSIILFYWYLLLNISCICLFFIVLLHFSLSFMSQVLGYWMRFLTGLPIFLCLSFQFIMYTSSESTLVVWFSGLQPSVDFYGLKAPSKPSHYLHLLWLHSELTSLLLIDMLSSELACDPGPHFSGFKAFP